MINVVEEFYFENAKQLLTEISPFGKLNHLLSGFIFRGESSDKYELLPSSLRPSNKKKLYELAGKEVISEQSEWEFWQQHTELECLKRFFVLADEKDMQYLKSLPLEMKF